VSHHRRMADSRGDCRAEHHTARALMAPLERTDFSAAIEDFLRLHFVTQSK
jgi:hypothetical protein